MVGPLSRLGWFKSAPRPFPVPCFNVAYSPWILIGALPYIPVDEKAICQPGWYRLIIHADASIGDRGVGVGYTIQTDGTVYEGSTHYEGSFTSMEGEYLALKEAARIAVQFFDSRQHLLFFTDCQGLVKKMEEPNGSERWNEKRDSFLEILARVSTWSIKWIPRGRNRDADALAHTARDSAGS